MKKNALPAIVAVIFAIFVFVFTFYMSSTEPEPQWSNQGWTQQTIQPQQPTPLPLPVQPQSNYGSAMQLARQQNKDVFIFFEADWCKWCKKMEVDTLAKPLVKRALSQYVYCVINVDREPRIAQQYGASPIPAYFIVNNKEQLLKAGKGYKGESAFLLWLGSKIGDNSPKLIGR